MKKAATGPSAPTTRAAGISQHTAKYQSQAIARGKAVSFGRQTAAQKSVQSVISRETLHICYTHEVQSVGQNLASRSRNGGSARSIQAATSSSYRGQNKQDNGKNLCP